jgi:hypothetical protein
LYQLDVHARHHIHQIDSGVIISFLKAILRKFRECVEIPLGIVGAAAKKLTNRLHRLLGKERTARGHLMYGAHECLVPVNYATSNVFKQLEEKQKAARHTRAYDYRHLLLLLPFVLSNVFHVEVEEHNTRDQDAHVVDPSEELVGVANIFQCWFKKFHQVIPAKTSADINILRSLSHRQCIIYIMHIMSTIQFIHIILHYTI